MFSNSFNCTPMFPKQWQKKETVRYGKCYFSLFFLFATFDDNRNDGILNCDFCHVLHIFMHCKCVFSNGKHWICVYELLPFGGFKHRYWFCLIFQLQFNVFLYRFDSFKCTIHNSMLVLNRFSFEFSMSHFLCRERERVFIALGICVNVDRRKYLPKLFEILSLLLYFI